MKEFEQWNGFEGRLWKEEVNVRDFIQNNYTQYEGDEEFLAGPTEATAIGNITVQMLHDGVFTSLPEARTCIGKSFDIRHYDENGNEIPNKTGSNILFGNTGEITYSSHGDVSRRMAEIDITLPENYKLNKRNLTDHLCQSCLDKVAASLEYWKYENEKKEPIPLCLVDFKTLDIYSLQDYYRSIFIRDYYVEMDFENNSVEIKVFYLPERL